MFYDQWHNPDRARQRRPSIQHQYDLGGYRTHSLPISSRTRYHCATKFLKCTKFHCNIYYPKTRTLFYEKKIAYSNLPRPGGHVSLSAPAPPPSALCPLPPRTPSVLPLCRFSRLPPLAVTRQIVLYVLNNSSVSLFLSRVPSFSFSSLSFSVLVPSRSSLSWSLFQHTQPHLVFSFAASSSSFTACTHQQFYFTI